MQSVYGDGVGGTVTDLDVEVERTGAEVGGMASGAGKRDCKTVARR